MREVTTVIDQEKCTGCALCLTVCPHDTLSMVNGKAQVTGTESLGCGHCAAICPVGAVTVSFTNTEAERLTTLDVPDEIIRPGDYDAARLVQLMRSRRSCRNFKKEPLSREVLEDLVRIGISAPSGTNCQLWKFTVLPRREAVHKLGEAMLAFFEKLNRLSGNAAIRFWSKLFLKDALGIYYRDYRNKVADSIREWKAGGRDRLFHGAPAAIVISMHPEASTPCEDALLASQNILLAAHAMGLGSCLIGFAVEAMRHDPSIKRLLGIPASEKVYSVIALGKPDENYRRPAGRRKVTPRFWEG